MEQFVKRSSFVGLFRENQLNKTVNSILSSKVAAGTHHSSTIDLIHATAAYSKRLTD